MGFRVLRFRVWGLGFRASPAVPFTFFWLWVSVSSEQPKSPCHNMVTGLLGKPFAETPWSTLNPLHC